LLKKALQKIEHLILKVKKITSMKKLIVYCVLFFGIQKLNAQVDPIVMEINGKPVLKSEFLQIYLKNNNNPKFDKASMDEYLEMFKKFKLKVAEAEALGYDTIPKLKKELEGYRKQLANPYLIDSAENKSLVEQAYERIKTEVRASHILIKVDPNASPKDTLEAYNKILGLKKRIEKGEDFSSVAKMKGGSDDPSAATNGGDLGFFTAFQMVYPFEEKAYTTPVGSISDPFRTRYGYHIVKVTDKRPARGTIKVAHIMVAAGKDAKPETIANAEKKINELYDKLLQGSKWEELVTAHSDDPGSSKKGGELPSFGSGTTQRMVPAFEEAAFSLKSDGEISKPVKTEYGFHIIKRLEWKDVQSFETLKKEIQNKVNKDERAKKTQDSFVFKLKKQYNYKKSPKLEIDLNWFTMNLDSTFYQGKWKSDKLASDNELFNIDGKSFTQKQFAVFLEKAFRNAKKEDFKILVDNQFRNWEKTAILEYEESKLLSKYPDYKALVNEYHDGIILYEVMSDKVWNKATKDTVGLKKFFDENREKYLWSRRLDAEIYECNSLENANVVFKMLKKKKNTSKEIIEKINATSELNLKVKVNKFDPEQTPSLKGRTFVSGRNKPYEFEGKHYVVKLTQDLPVIRKEFSEARGAATSDYQNYLEKTWIEELSKKYPVKVNFDILYNLNKK
jgi:peptidyl-prolyl cis-trans isomerase SurA